ncbi:bifunctional UDP-N-acetylglucosamine diphosphorylase/glucosamine-1-phosphate N-acetyltransferase GlmU [Caldimonas thermodepolymerans]|jgi:UDP-N-acetylglucosamine diphosphorylase/glucosamine-1-phosphate N-acetyltransferase|uniref:Bifunctional protein GlmU n=1 Tax=Caldimonas thermodepolymerans TaxID=215580 RepID=A0AA46DF43_9BURK|nr:bifunctional UDP-N-acetylglucosamine diphosphorylase/glucosamine-1-phosphate N-acetyltransferase GlmU [Caldimonas thermodepolymerans]QPC32026.1 bifunctional UDP-N-acetylglucosamine diphosphorylase/glucosamine-1-phosphate N-acetyltransferase GlmU [Caldimonas thermodepolymerans]RDI01446.1 UDP-N-acetylglucosamine pyrophosphorylase /glucosamine-1-phosphate N-acetyltransferase [Caldimonas thermodepolymerans]TCP08334.1 UDP-N-acetylglucosamine pyrophosphorylase /glucosamine-1-phosphate N-acetyltrans
MALDVVIMAAGKGTRMKSNRPKVLHTLGGRALLQHVVQTATALAADRIVVITGHGAAQVEAAVQAPGLQFVRQEPQLGTGHAVQQAAPALSPEGTTLILNGDVPLIAPETARALVEACGGQRLALLTIALDDPTGYGRILRRGGAPDGDVLGIVEHKDATPEQRGIREIYTGMMAVPTARLKQWLGRLRNDNAQGEYYLTDIVAMAVADGVPVVAAHPRSETEVLGVNSPSQLADLERRYQRQQAERLMEAGVRLADPARFDLRGTLECGMDVEIDVNCVFEGQVVLGDGVRIGANCVIRNARIAAGAVIHPYTHIDGEKLGVEVGEGALVGPFARLRPGAVLGAEVHIGNFVEVKNSTLARGAKANHLAYLGDATVGERVNYGAGSITANYDGANKHRTVIGDDVHVGSNCVLIAPVTIGAGATIGGGSTISKDAPAGQLTVARARQVTVPGWTRPRKKA